MVLFRRGRQFDGMLGQCALELRFGNRPLVEASSQKPIWINQLLNLQKLVVELPVLVLDRLGVLLDHLVDTRQHIPLLLVHQLELVLLPLRIFWRHFRSCGRILLSKPVVLAHQVDRRIYRCEASEVVSGGLPHLKAAFLYSLNLDFQILFLNLQAPQSLSVGFQLLIGRGYLLLVQEVLV